MCKSCRSHSSNSTTCSRPSACETPARASCWPPQWPTAAALWRRRDPPTRHREARAPDLSRRQASGSSGHGARPLGPPEAPARRGRYIRSDHGHSSPRAACSMRRARVLLVPEPVSSSSSTTGLYLKISPSLSLFGARVISAS